MDLRRVARHLGGGHEAKVIVAVRGLRSPAGVHAVDLRSHLVVRAKPGLGGQGDAFAAIIGCEIGRVGKAVFFQAVPDAVIGAGFGKMVAPAFGSSLLIGDYLFENLGRPVNGRMVGQALADDDDARTR
jgi:hypothetical protein